jgi:hypothetical protein
MDLDIKYLSMEATEVPPAPDRVSRGKELLCEPRRQQLADFMQSAHDDALLIRRRAPTAGGAAA